MNIERVITDPETSDMIAPYADSDISPKHDAWMHSEIKTTLAKKAAGNMSFLSLDEVMKKFGFNAR